MARPHPRRSPLRPRVLKERERYAHATWHAQQACELGLKSLMFRTCGVTDEELRGKRAHSLADFVESIGGQACPVSRADLIKLSRAYLRARYTSKYERSEQLPADLYGASEADAALRHAQQLLAWLGSLNAVPAPHPSSASAQHTNEGAAPNATTRIASDGCYR